MEHICDRLQNVLFNNSKLNKLWNTIFDYNVNSATVDSYKNRKRNTHTSTSTLTSHTVGDAHTYGPEDNCARYLFSNKITDEWNFLTKDVASCNT